MSDLPPTNDPVDVELPADVDRPVESRPREDRDDR